MKPNATNLQWHPGWQGINPDSSIWWDATRRRGTSSLLSMVFLLVHLMPNRMSCSNVRNSHLEVDGDY